MPATQGTADPARFLPYDSGTQLHREIRAGETHTYRLDPLPDTYLRLEVEQRDIDLLVTLNGAEEPLEVDGPTGEDGTERLEFVSRETAEGYLLEIEAYEGSGDGAYGLKVIESHYPASDGEGLRAEAALAFCRGEQRRWDGERREAQAHFQRSLDLARQAAALDQQADALERLGRTGFRLGSPERAAADYRQAIDLYRELGEERLTALAQVRLSEIEAARGEADAALRLVEAAQATFLRLGDHRRWLGAVNRRGLILQGSGELRQALDLYEAALAADPPDRQRAYALTNMADLLGRLGRLEPAYERLRQAEALLADAGDPGLLAVVVDKRGVLEERLEQPEAALELYGRALELYGRFQDPASRADALYGLARAEALRGETRAALGAIETAVALTEELRAGSLGAALAASFLAGAQDRYGLWIRLLMQLHREAPEAGHAARALAISERARARSLLDTLEAARAGARQGADPALLEARRKLGRRLNRAATARQAAGPGSPEASRAAGEVNRLIEELEGLERRMLGAQPRLALLNPAPLDLEGIRRQALDGDSLLLEYRLGGRQSYLWVVGRDLLQSFLLPPRREIEATLRRVLDYLPRSHRREGRGRGQTALCELTRQLLAPAAHLLADRRLLVASDGALALLPFAALPDPAHGDCLGAPPLVAGHEIVRLPSASALAMLRRATPSGTPGAGIGILADPIFGQRDERLPAAEASRAEGLGGDLPRLPHTRREAEAILARAQGHPTFLGVGFDAHKGAVLDGSLRGFRVLHFATHGLLDTERPELSGVALSRFDRQGQPRDGILRLHEIYGLDLPAELVVLSACQTGLGKRIRGEGLEGLTRGFLVAGARAVLVSLWKVQDAATAELMDRFYHHLLTEQLRPAAALRAAQLSLWQDPAWQAPSYWGAFVLEGDG